MKISENKNNKIGISVPRKIILTPIPKPTNKPILIAIFVLIRLLLHFKLHEW